MNISVRPHTQALAALLAAGAVTAASIVPLPAQHELPAVSTAEVRSASVVTDGLYNLGTVVVAGTNAIGISADAIVSLPFTGLFAAASALQSPADVASLLSYVTQLYLNPSYAALVDLTYPAEFRFYVLETLISVLPETLANGAYDAIDQVADAIAGLFVGLPDSTAGDDLMYSNQFLTQAGRTLSVAQFGITAPVWALANVINYLGYLPADLEAVLESAIQQPNNIPGLVSYLAHSAADTLDNVVSNLVYPLTYLPAPVGSSTTTDDGLAYDFINGFSTTLADFLNRVLPPPVNPTPFPSNLVTLNVAPSNLAAPTTIAPNSVNTDDEEETANSTGLPGARAELAPTGDLKEPTAVVQKLESVESAPASPAEVDPPSDHPAPPAEADPPSDQPAAEVDSVTLKVPKVKIKPTRVKDALRGSASKSRTENPDSSAPQGRTANDSGSADAGDGQSGSAADGAPARSGDAAKQHVSARTGAKQHGADEAN